MSLSQDGSLCILRGITDENFQNNFYISFSEDRLYSSEMVQTLMNCRLIWHFIWGLHCLPIYPFRGFWSTKGMLRNAKGSLTNS